MRCDIARRGRRRAGAHYTDRGLLRRDQLRGSSTGALAWPAPAPSGLRSGPWQCRSRRSRQFRLAGSRLAVVPHVGDIPVVLILLVRPAQARLALGTHGSLRYRSARRPRTGARIARYLEVLLKLQGRLLRGPRLERRRPDAFQLVVRIRNLDEHPPVPENPSRIGRQVVFCRRSGTAAAAAKLEARNRNLGQRLPLGPLRSVLLLPLGRLRGNRRRREPDIARLAKAVLYNQIARPLRGDLLRRRRRDTDVRRFLPQRRAAGHGAVPVQHGREGRRLRGRDLVQVDLDPFVARRLGIRRRLARATPAAWQPTLRRRRFGARKRQLILLRLILIPIPILIFILILILILHPQPAPIINSTPLRSRSPQKLRQSLRMKRRTRPPPRRQPSLAPSHSSPPRPRAPPLRHRTIPLLLPPRPLPFLLPFPSIQAVHLIRRQLRQARARPHIVDLRQRLLPQPPLRLPLGSSSSSSSSSSGRR